jgi:hypothetical protein
MQDWHWKLEESFVASYLLLPKMRVYTMPESSKEGLCIQSGQKRWQSPNGLLRLRTLGKSRTPFLYLFRRQTVRFSAC